MMRMVSLAFGRIARAWWLPAALLVACGDDSTSPFGPGATGETGTVPGSSSGTSTSQSGPDTSGDASADTTGSAATTTGTTTSGESMDASTAPECVDDGECEDDNPCTIDACDAGVCDHESLDAVPAPDAAQVEGDCIERVCVAGEATDEIDDTDLPDDDDPCTDDVCTGGVPSNPPAAEGTPCSGDGFCDGAGTCSDCVTADDCDQFPTDDDCQQRTCIDHVCGQSFADVGTPVNDALQTDADCLVVVCDGAGGTQDDPDDADVPVDGLECTLDECNAGVPDNPPSDAGTDCSAGTCDGLGGCVGCLTPADCGGIDTFCQTITCIDNVCGVDNEDAGVPLPDADQEDADCQLVVCDGAGLQQNVPDDGDVPTDDGNECTEEICVDGVPDHPNEEIDTTCNQNGGSFCDGAGECVECNADAQCTDADQCDVPACNDNVCGQEPMPNGTACDDQLFCTFSDTCNGSGICVGAGDPCPGADGDGDCSEACSEQFDSCVGNDPNGATCDDGLFCTATDTCNGSGTCNGGGSPCAGADGDSNCAESCNEAADNCLGNDPGGSACNDGLFCTATDTCNGLGACTSTGNPCIGPDGDNDCSESCNEVTNNCTGNDPMGSACSDTLFCTLIDTCNAVGVCVGTSNPCPGADGDSDCSEACNEASNTCTSNDPNGTACTDNVFCNGTNTCQNGSCTASGINPCPGADGDSDCSETCNEASDNCTSNDPMGSACTDGLFCTGVETCNNAGQCISPGNPCPGADGDADCSETCSEAADACSGNDPNNSVCNDGLFCTETDRCNNSGSCVGSGNPCDGSDNDTDCSEQCRENMNDCQGADPNNTACDDSCGLCEGGSCVTLCP